MIYEDKARVLQKLLFCMFVFDLFVFLFILFYYFFEGGNRMDTMGLRRISNKLKFRGGSVAEWSALDLKSGDCRFKPCSDH